MRGLQAGWRVSCLFAALGGAFAAQSVAAPSATAPPTPSPALGIFQGQSDVGSVVPAGTALYEPSSDRYVLTSAGANTWYHIDAFHYLWTKTAGDWTLTAQVTFPPTAYSHEPNPHRKGILMFRQSLDAGSAYAAFAVHGVGLPALQFRRERGANTEDIEIDMALPATIRIEKRGDVFTAFLSQHGEPLNQVGASAKIHLQSPFYVGLGALSHDADTTDRVVFSHVALERTADAKNSPPVLYSTIETIQVEDQYRRAAVVRSVAALVQSVNWTAGGKALYVDEAGRLERIELSPSAGAAPAPVALGALADCSGNFGLSPDGHWLAVSCRGAPGAPHQVHLVPSGGGPPRALTAGPVPSFFHAWSADSRLIAFTRGRASQADIFTIPAAGGAEARLTEDTRNDGPDFSPDGQFIYFDSSRSGTLQLWRMHVDGSQAEQLTDDAGQNHSPHVSPDGKYLAFLSQPAGAGPGIGDAALRIMAFGEGLIRTVANFQGDRDSFAMYSWGDLNHVAFVSYQRLP